MGLHSRNFGLTVFALMIGISGAAQAEPTLTLPLEEYQRLHQGAEVPAVTVVDLLRVGGSFRGKDLTLTLTGRATGRRSSVTVLENASSIRVYGCEGDGLLSRNDKGAFELTPLVPKFNVRCRLSAAGSDRLALSASSSVLWVESSISDGEMVVNDQTSGGWSLSVVRNVGSTDGAKAADVIPPSAIGRYRISLHPDETRFRYQLDVRNPNRIRQPFDVTLGRTDHVQQVDAQISYEVEGSRYRFDLPPGETTIVLTGTLAGTDFRAPVTASVQYLVIESHPLLRPTVEKAAKRINPKETGMTASFRGAQAFLLGADEQVSWTVAKLEALHTTGFALNSAHHTFFVTPEGRAIAESTLNLDNQGAADITLPMRAEPRFASLNAEPVLLTRNAEGNLWMPLYQGPQTLVTQFEEGLSQKLGLAWGTLWLPEVKAPASATDIELRFSKEWIPLYQRFNTESRLKEPAHTSVEWVLVQAIWTFLVAGLLGLIGRWRVAVALAAVVMTLATPWADALVTVLNLAVTLLWVVPQISRRIHPLVSLVLVGMAGFIALFLVAEMTGRERSMSSRASVSYDMKSMSRNSNEGNKEGEDRKGADGYVDSAFQGLPAKVQLPNGSNTTSFRAELLSTQTPRGVRVLLITNARAVQIGTALALLALLLIASRYRTLRTGFQRLLTEARDLLKKPLPTPEPAAE